MITHILAFALHVTTVAFSATPSLIPRTPTPIYRSDVFFEGGADFPATLHDLRMADHGRFERWVIDFSNASGLEKKKQAPKFQVRFLPSQKIETDTGEIVLSQPAKLIVTFHKVNRNDLQKQRLSRLVEKSAHIQKIVIYPPIENGDTAMEFTFSADSPVNIHQPLENEGRLVIDIAALSKK
jgi:hypothetical protein